MDLRIKKTKESLVCSLLVLLELKNIDSITVNDLCTEAMVGRSAFYSHFKDKYDLLHYSMQKLKIQWFQKLDSSKIDVIIPSIITELNKNKKVLKNIIICNQNQEIIKMFHVSFHEDLKLLLIQNNYNFEKNAIPLEVTAFLSSSAIGNMIIYWIEHNHLHSEEVLANYILIFLKKFVFL